MTVNIPHLQQQIESSAWCVSFRLEVMTMLATVGIDGGLPELVCPLMAEVNLCVSLN